MLTACSPSKNNEQAQIYDTAEQAEKAIAEESAKIDQLIAQIREVKSEAERKKLMCVQIPAQYEQLTQSLKANQHLMKIKDDQVIKKMHSILREQQEKFLNAAICQQESNSASSVASSS